jgi:phosphoglycolate phosphatase-like HAD superfamily hydrolase
MTPKATLGGSGGTVLQHQLVLFDIDGTLVVTGGAGQRAMNRAFADVFGIPDAFKHVELAGRTDTSILGDAFERQGMTAGPSEVGAFRERYLVCLREEIPRPGRNKRLLPGITPLLDALAPEPKVFLGLLTGNYADAAEVKLGHFDLWRYFRCGAFGEDAHDRNHLVPVALGRARERGLPHHVEPEHVVVIGDTPRDVACAHAHGARVIAVATGQYTRAALAQAGAEVVFDDFSETEDVLLALRGVVGSRQ